MNAMRRFAGLFQDSPTYGRDRANLLSGFTIGTTGLLLNAAVLFLVFPLMLEPDDRSFRAITENVEFGQLLALILLGGATAFATVLIPIRLMTVFWGPRVGGYFDQIVLSGITPLRFMIGKATSQNLFLGLALFLLLPYLVLSLTLGGVNLGFFLAGLLLVWMYCMALSLVTLWASLYFNELLAAIFVIAGAGVISGFGCSPLLRQAFAVTPFPALVHPIYASMPSFGVTEQVDFLPVFVSCVLGMGVVIGVSLFAIYVGPLYGIIRENSTFGEVVRAGDSKRKRWLRLRPHIQRPSELAFFYENRSATFRRREALIRWGLGFSGMVLLTSVAFGSFVYWLVTWVINRNVQWRWAYEFHATTLAIHGCCLVVGAFVFAHAKNTTLLRLPIIGARTAFVSRLDTLAFLAFVLTATAYSIGMPIGIEHFLSAPAGQTIYPELMRDYGGRRIDFVRASIEGSWMISFTALVVYALYRFSCLFTWIKSGAFLVSTGLYFFLVCLTPMMVAAAFLEIHELRNIPMVVEWAPRFGMVSPINSLVSLFNSLGSQFPRDVSTVPFYLVHGLILAVAIFGIRRGERMLHKRYLESPGVGRADG